MEIIPFQKSDQQATETFMKSIYQEMGWIPKYDDGLDKLEKFFHLPQDGFLLLVKDNNEIIGTGGCVKLNEHDDLLKRFYIHKDHRGKGLAQKLFQKIIDKTKRRNLSRIVIDVAKKNTRAIRFYEKCGFRKYEQSPIAAWPESTRPEIFNYYFLDIQQ